MNINKIQISNYKSYKKLDIEFKKFNVLIGPNAAGKSNCIQSLTFFRHIISYGLNNAISLQGGLEFLRNMNIGDKDNRISFSIWFSPDKNFKFFKTHNRIKYRFEIYEFLYEFTLKINDDEEKYSIIEDKLTQKYNLFKLGRKATSKTFITNSEFAIIKHNEKFRFKAKRNKNVDFKANELSEIFFIGFEDFTIEKRLLKTSQLKKTLMFETPLYFMPHLETLKRDFANISIYDIDPKQSKQATSIAGKSDLDEDGGNIALVLKRILADEMEKRKFLNLIKYLLPFVKSLKVERLLDKYLRIGIQENYSSDNSIPGFLLSDGTVFVLAILIALYFEDKPIVVFEEPERRLHPKLISKVIDMVKDASESKQIILSTHNPEIVKYAGIENIIFIARDKDGFSIIGKPNEKEEVMTFLENEIGIDELFVQGLLG